MSDLFQPDRPIKAISLWQPWASLVARGVKRHETRHWLTAYRGPIAIHAAKTLDTPGAPDWLCLSALGVGWKEDLPRGCVVAVGRLRQIHRAETIVGRLNPADLLAGNYAPGRWAWEIAGVRPLIAPIPAVGRQGLFNWLAPDDLDARLGPVLDHEAVCAGLGWTREPGKEVAS